MIVLSGVNAGKLHHEERSVGRVVVALLDSILEAFRSLVELVGVDVAVAFERVSSGTDDILGGRIVVEIFNGFVVFTLLVKEDSGLEVGTVAGFEALFVGYLSVLSESHGVVALSQSEVGGADSVVGFVDAGSAEEINVGKDYGYDSNHNQRNDADKFLVVLHFCSHRSKLVVEVVKPSFREFGLFF